MFFYIFASRRLAVQFSKGDALKATSSAKKNEMKIAHILLVEDNEGDIVLTMDAFEESKTKTNISVAKNGGDALDLFFKRRVYENSDRPDMVLLNINLPVHDGHDVLDQIKKTPHLRKFRSSYSLLLLIRRTFTELMKTMQTAM